MAAAPTPTLHAAIEHMESWRLEPLGGGYARILGACYTILVAFLDEVCEAERDDYLRLFSHHRQQRREAMRWLTVRFLEMSSMDNAEYRQSHDALRKRLLEVLPPEEVMQGFTPEERQAGIRPADDSRRCAALAFEDQRGAVRALSPEDRAALRKLLDESS